MIKLLVTNTSDLEKDVILVKVVTATGKPVPNYPYRELKGGDSAAFEVSNLKQLQISELNVNK